MRAVASSIKHEVSPIKAVLQSDRLDFLFIAKTDVEQMTSTIARDVTDLPGFREFVRSRRVHLLILVVSVLLVYGQAATFSFINYDDNELVYQNEEFLSNVGHIFTAFTNPIHIVGSDPSIYYRPVLTVSYILDYQIWRLNPAGYHITNVLLHLAASLLLFYLVGLVVNSSLVALSASLVFALHPIQTEAVAWVGARNDVLLGVFVVLTMIFHMRYRQSADSSRGYLMLTTLAFALAMFTKETGAIVLFLFPLYDLCFTGLRLRSIVSLQYIRKFWGMFLIVAVYLIARVSVFGEMFGAEKLYGSTPLLERIGQVPAIVCEYTALVFYPARLSVEHPLKDLLWSNAPWNLVAVSLLVGFLAAIWWTRTRERILCFGLSWIAITMLPILNIVPLPIPMMEYRLYVPMVGCALVVSHGCERLLHRMNREKQFTFAIVILALVLGGLSFSRLPVWKSSESLFADAIAKSPRVGRPYFNLAGYYYESARYDESIPLLKKYIELNPADLRGYTFLRQICYVAHRYPEMVQLCKQMIELDPSNPTRYLETGISFEQINQPDSALPFYERGVQLDSTVVLLHSRLGVVLEKLQQFDRAELEYERAISLQPGNGDLYIPLAKYFSSRGKHGDAIRLIEKANTFHAPSPQTVQFLRQLYEETGQAQKAQELMRRYHF